jgi:RNase P subunit RPR2
MICPERQRLLIDYRDAAHRYSEAVSMLVELIGLELNADMELLRRNCRRASEITEQARTALHRHEADHFCDRSDFVSEPSWQN